MSYRYKGRTERGREVVETDLGACLESLCFIANKDPNRAWLKADSFDPSLWHVYESKEAGSDANGWFAVISKELP